MIREVGIKKKIRKKIGGGKGAGNNKAINTRPKSCRIKIKIFEKRTFWSVRCFPSLEVCILS